MSELRKMKLKDDVLREKESCKSSKAAHVSLVPEIIILDYKRFR